MSQLHASREENAHLGKSRIVDDRFMLGDKREQIIPAISFSPRKMASRIPVSIEINGIPSSKLRHFMVLLDEGYLPSQFLASSTFMRTHSSK